MVKDTLNNYQITGQLLQLCSLHMHSMEISLFTSLVLHLYNNWVLWQYKDEPIFSNMQTFNHAVQNANRYMLQCHIYSIFWVYFTTSEIGLGVVASATTTSWPSETPRSKDVDEEKLSSYFQRAQSDFCHHTTHKQRQHYWNWNTNLLFKIYLNWLWNMEVR